MTQKQSAIKNYLTSTTFFHAALTVLVLLILGYVALYGDDRWFSKEKGLAIEKRQVIIESDSKHRDDLIMKEQHHMHEKLDDMRVEQKEDITELKNIVIDYLRSTRQ